MGVKRVVVHIDRLVLNGFQREDRSGIAAGLQSELGRLLSAPGTAERLVEVGNWASVKGSNLRINHDAKAEATGVGVARAISGGLLP